MRSEMAFVHPRPGHAPTSRLDVEFRYWGQISFALLSETILLVNMERAFVFLRAFKVYVARPTRRGLLGKVCYPD
jgi:hypothetical protein